MGDESGRRAHCRKAAAASHSPEAEAKHRKTRDATKDAADEAKRLETEMRIKVCDPKMVRVFLDPPGKNEKRGAAGVPPGKLKKN